MTQQYDAVTGRALVRALQSLTDSTCLTVTVRQVEYHAVGLCSPYLSHQHVTVAPAALSPAVGLMLQNERFTITINAVPAHQEGHARHTALVASSAILAACERLARIVPGLAAELRSQLSAALVAVSICLPRVVAFDDADPLAGITEASFSPDDEPPAPVDDDPEPEPEG